MNTFTVDGTSCSTYGLIVSGSQTFGDAERDAESISIPGRNGDLIVDRKRYKNVVVPYQAFITRNFAANASNLRDWLGSLSYGYHRLTDDYSTDSFRLARYIGPLEWDMTQLNRAGQCEIRFDCKPQRFLYTGETAVSIRSGTMTNPTLQDARPLLKITGSSSSARVYIGGIEIAIAHATQTLYYDCETGNAYDDTSNRNSDVTAPTIPVLHPGANTIGTTNVSRLEITPRWWKL